MDGYLTRPILRAPAVLKRDETELKLVVSYLEPLKSYEEGSSPDLGYNLKLRRS